MVIIQPSTGDILAVANNDGANDFALTARVAPGSTNKIITSTALFASGLVSSPSQPVECPLQLVINGNTFKNDKGESEPPGTPFLTDFAASCNNACARWYSSLGASALAQTAQKSYGLNQQWNIGIGPGGPYYTIPSTAYNGELAQELFGQGQLATAPLAMASVAATVDTGSFKQPIVVAGQPQLAATPLPASVHQDMWQMMRAVTQAGGTAAGVFDGVGSAVYGKTGTADVGGQGQPNSWMVAFDPALNVAVGCLVLSAGYGAAVAGPEVAAALQQLAH
jgi:cell division protein FtsI/penicillin-binding protein 2